jgi:hypothetical protein
MLELPQVAYSSGDIIVWRRCQKVKTKLRNFSGCTPKVDWCGISCDIALISSHDCFNPASHLSFNQNSSRNMAEPSIEGFSRPSAFFTFKNPNHVTLSRRRGVRMEDEGMICHPVLFSTRRHARIGPLPIRSSPQRLHRRITKNQKERQKRLFDSSSYQTRAKEMTFPPACFSHRPLSMSILVQMPGFMMKRGVRLSWSSSRK